jgi:hypothetical protein
MPKLLAGSQQNAFLKSGAKILWSVKSFVETPGDTANKTTHITFSVSNAHPPLTIYFHLYYVGL